jgi:hypothetical protein
MIAIESDDAWFNRPVLDANETVVRSFPANHTQGKRAVGGKLFLTNRRVIFVPNRVDWNIGGQIWEASRDAIQTVARDRPHFSIVELFSGALLSRLVVSTLSGERAFFVVNDLDKIVADLSEYIREGKAEPIRNK